MPLLVSAFSVAKRGAKASENQDAVWPRGLCFRNGKQASGSVEPPSKNGRTLVGIADGATEGVLSGEWANITLKAFSRVVREIKNSEHVLPVVRDALKTWERIKCRRTKNGSKPLTGLPAWLEEEAVARGAFTTACVAWFSDEGEWGAVAVGDSCVFHLRQHELLQAWPLFNSSEFNSSPYLISSEPACNADLASHIKTHQSNWRFEDQIYFATDALACWILREEEQQRSPWRKLAMFDSRYEEDFSTFVEALRDAGEIRNDDTTLVCVKFTPQHPAS